MKVDVHELFVHFDGSGEGPKNGLYPRFTMEFARLPVAGEFVSGIRPGKAHQVLDVVHHASGGADVFVTETSLPADMAERLGVTEGMPSLAGFDGTTVGELVRFFAQYPSDYRIEIEDRQILVARAKSGYIIVRLDDQDE